MVLAQIRYVRTAIANSAAALGLAILLGACAATPEERDTAWEPYGVLPANPSGSNADTGTAPLANAVGPPSGECREYSTTVISSGQPLQVRGRACLQPDGSWRIDVPAAAASGPPGQAMLYPAYPYPLYEPWYPYPFYTGSAFFGGAFLFSDHDHHHHDHDHDRDRDHHQNSHFEHHEGHSGHHGGQFMQGPGR